MKFTNRQIIGCVIGLGILALGCLLILTGALSFMLDISAVIETEEVSTLPTIHAVKNEATCPVPADFAATGDNTLTLVDSETGEDVGVLMFDPQTNTLTVTSIQNDSTSVSVEEGSYSLDIAVRTRHDGWITTRGYFAQVYICGGQLYFMDDDEPSNEQNL